jgi:outer membrane protein TolC
MKTLLASLLLMNISFWSDAIANPVTFNEVWKQVLEQSPEVTAQIHQSKASQLSLSRARMHWLPELAVKAQAYSTNDSASNFFGNLSQRSVQSQDFTPGTLNAPGLHSFQNITLGIDLPLFEGGRKNELVKAGSAEFDASVVMIELKKRELFAETLTRYARLVTDQNTKSKLITLKNQIQEILSRYTIGDESNPVGYSGVLGLQGLSNRIDAEALSIDASQKSNQTLLAEEAAITAETLVPSEADIKTIVFSNLKKLDSPLVPNTQSIAEELSRAKETSFLAMKDAERARFFPKVGLFANESLTHGARDSGYATTAGAYLQWALFNSDDYNRVSEQNERQLAVANETLKTVSDTRAATKTLNDNEITIEKTLNLLLEGDLILTKQVKVTSRLFRSGSISALQLSEVYNRRADLILSLRQSEQNWIDLKAKKVLMFQNNKDDL